MSSVREERAFWLHQLHGRLLNSIGAAVIQSQVCEQALKFGSSVPLDEVLRLKKMLLDLEGITRAMVTSAARRRPLSLAGEIQHLIEEFRRNYPWIAFEARIQGPEKRIPRRVSSGVSVILHEALANSVKHANPSRTEIDLSLDRRSILLRVRDDGRGFDARQLAAPSSEGTQARHSGLTIMRHHTEMLGGRLEVTSVEGRGTQITLYVPLDSNASKSATRTGGRRTNLPAHQSGASRTDGEPASL